jgi:glycosyltransferase involved in cell wall biosynthesis
MNCKGLRIGLVGPLAPPAGGMANQTRQLADLLAAEGAAMTVVQVNAPYWPAWVVGLPVLRALCRLLPYLRTLWRTAGQVDLFHVMANSGWSWHLFAAPAVWIAHWRGVPVVVNYRGGEAEEFLQQSAPVVRYTLRRASALVVPSGFLRDVFARFGIQAQIVPNIINLSMYQPHAGKLSAVPHLVVARNLEPLYSIGTAIQAFRIISACFPGARLSITGTGPEANALAQLVDELGLTNYAVFTGQLDREAMADLYRSADLLLNPSLADNMPNSLLEAWASGVPVVSTRVGGIPYLAQDGVTASLVPPSDPIAMAQASVLLLCNQTVWQQRVQAGLQEVKRYTWSCVQPLLTDVYRLALQQASPRLKEFA